MTYILRCFAVALALPLDALSAQGAPALVAGARVRVTAPEPEPDCAHPDWPGCYRKVVGSLVSVDSSAIVVRVENGETVNVRRAPSTRLEVLYEGHSSTGRGALVGLVVGATTGAIAGGSSHNPAPFTSGGLAQMGAMLGGAAGALLGAVIGSVVKHGGWERVSLGHAHMTLVPHGAGLALSLTF